MTLSDLLKVIDNYAEACSNTARYYIEIKDAHPNEFDRIQATLQDLHHTSAIKHTAVIKALMEFRGEYHG